MAWARLLFVDFVVDPVVTMSGGRAFAVLVWS